jgi:transcriptional regulator GlxA family with amidase domain
MESDPLLEFERFILFQNALLLLLRSYDKPQSKSSQSIYRIANVLIHMEQNFRDELQHDDLANIAKMSSSTFLRTFKKSTGMTPIQYLIKLRVDEAIILLCTTSYSIQEIALNVGFQDSNYFCRQFRKFKSMSPRQWRKLSET